MAESTSVLCIVLVSINVTTVSYLGKSANTCTTSRQCGVCLTHPPSLHNGAPEVSSWAAAASQCSQNGSISYCSRPHAKTSWPSLTAPEDPDHPWSTVGSHLYCKLKRTCKVKAHCFWLGLPSAVAKLRTAVSQASIQLDWKQFIH